MRVVVDGGRCVGNGICEAVNPAAFEVSDEGIVIVHEEAVREDDRESVTRAVASCPALALRLVED